MTTFVCSNKRASRFAAHLCVLVLGVLAFIEAPQALAQAYVIASPSSSVNIGSIPAGQSYNQVVGFTVFGGSALIKEITVTGDFSLNYHGCYLNTDWYYDGQGCNVTVRITPGTAGAKSGTIEFKYQPAGYNATTRTVVLAANAYGYAWLPGNWGSCSASCGGGTQTRSVVCERTDSHQVVADSSCAGAKPAATQSCNTQSCVVYSWFTGTWSTWSSDCSSSGTRARTVYCRGSDGIPVGDSNCTDVKPAEQETAERLEGCSYSWAAQPAGPCMGGSAQWEYGEWGPSSGCGAIAQSRTAACIVDALSGAQPLQVTCLRSDNTAAADEFCAAPRPAETAACSPVGTACSGTPSTQQTVQLNDQCRSSCVPDASQGKFCLMLPL